MDKGSVCGQNTKGLKGQKKMLKFEKKKAEHKESFNFSCGSMSFQPNPFGIFLFHMDDRIGVDDSTFFGFR